MNIHISLSLNPRGLTCELGPVTGPEQGARKAADPVIAYRPYI